MTLPPPLPPLAAGIGSGRGQAWKPLQLRLLLSRAAAYSEVLAGGASCPPLVLGPWLPHQHQHHRQQEQQGLQGHRHGHARLCVGSWRTQRPGLYWGLWLLCPTLLVAHDAVQVRLQGGGAGCCTAVVHLCQHLTHTLTRCGCEGGSSMGNGWCVKRDRCAPQGCTKEA